MLPFSLLLSLPVRLRQLIRLVILHLAVDMEALIALEYPAIEETKS